MKGSDDSENEEHNEIWKGKVYEIRRNKEDKINSKTKKDSEILCKFGRLRRLGKVERF